MILSDYEFTGWIPDQDPEWVKFKQGLSDVII